MTDSDGNEIGKIFVGGLSQATNDDKLRIYFSQLGEIDDSVVMMDNKTGRSRGFGYVKYRNPESVDLALQSKPHIIDLKEVDVKQCNVNMKGKNRRSLKVFVGGISLDHDAESIRQFFQQFGAVTDINLMMDQSKLRHRGFAFVGFEDENIVKKLINIHFVNINSKQVEIKAMEPPNFSKKFQQTNEHNVSSSNGINNTFTSHEQSMNISGTFISSCPTQSLWRPSVIQYPQSMVWSPQLSSSGWVGSPPQWNGQWSNHCDHTHWPAINWACPSTWYHQVPSQTMWSSPTSNWLPVHVANQASVQTSKPHILAPAQTHQTVDNSNQLIQSWPNEATPIPQRVSPTTSFENPKVPSTQIQPNVCCGFLAPNVDSSNHFSGNVAPTDYCSWFYGPGKEALNSSPVSPINSNDFHIPGGGAGDYNRNINQDSSFAFYATRN